MTLILVHGLQTQRAISAFPLHLLLLVLVPKENFLLLPLRQLSGCLGGEPGAEGLADQIKES